MTATSQPKLTVDEFLRWAENQPGRWELHEGVPYAMAPARTRHGQVKFKVQAALLNAIKRLNCQCHMLPDGATVRISAKSAFEPDALVYCGKELPGDAVEVPEPVIIVEVLSPSTQRIDASVKLIGYFSLPSVRHYLMINPEAPPVVLHSRQSDGRILTSIIPDGAIVLDPPGLEISVAELFAPL